MGDWFCGLTVSLVLLVDWFCWLTGSVILLVDWFCGSHSNSSVLSGELPPAMGKTALFYHSGGSSGYESMVRDSSENTGSTSSTQDSLSEDSTATTSSRRSSKNSKKSRSSTGTRTRTSEV